MNKKQKVLHVSECVGKDMGRKAEAAIKERIGLLKGDWSIVGATSTAQYWESDFGSGLWVATAILLEQGNAFPSREIKVAVVGRRDDDRERLIARRTAKAKEIISIDASSAISKGDWYVVTTMVVEN